MATGYGDKDEHRMAVITLMEEYIQLPQESVGAYANHVKVNWRQAGWNRQKQKEVLYDIAWAGLCNCLKKSVGLMTLTCGRFDTLHDFFDKATASDVMYVGIKMPQQQHQLTDSSTNGGKQGYRPSIPEPADTTSGGNSGQLGSNRHGKSDG